MKRLLFPVFCLMCILLVSGNAPAATHNVSVVDSSFNPSPLTINEGDTVTWTLNGILPHTVTSGPGCTSDGLFNSGTLGSTPFSHTFATAGTFPYFCGFHCAIGMTGTIVVNAASALIPVPAGPHVSVPQPVAAPVIGASFATSSPFGTGPFATGGSILNLEIGLGQHAAPVDVYLALSASAIPNTIIFLLPDLSLATLTFDQVVQAFTGGIFPSSVLPWMPNVSTQINSTIFTGVPVSDLPAGQYVFYLLVVPAGGTLADFDLYATAFTVGVPMTVTLSGAQEVPAVSTQATATANLAVNFTTGQILGTMDFSGLSSNATAAHIHQAAAGVNGPVILPLSGGAGATSGTWTISGILTPEQLTALRNNQLYLNVHSANFEGGEIRGQIIFPAISFTTSLNGGQEVPPVGTQATGSGSFTVDINTGAVNGTLSFSGLSSNATAAHIHQAAAGVNGPVILPLSGGAGATSGTWTISGTLTLSDLAALAADQLYLNVHSANFADGEIRGQILYPPGVPIP